ncbi:MAG TPA: hypothetical protein VGJ54_04960 [Streptosporangiaceae bacterium]
MKNQARAVTAMAVVAFGAVGCSAAIPVGGPRGQLSHLRTSPPAAMSADCRPDQLGAALEGSGQPGTAGMALANVNIWDKAATACTLAAPVTVTGLNQAGRPVTSSVRFLIAPGSPQLSPDGAGPDKLGRMPAREVSASMLLIAAGAHPNGPGLSCPAQHIDPATWRITLASGGSITTPNASPATGPALTRDGGLTTCRGRLGGQSPILITHGAVGQLVPLARDGRIVFVNTPSASSVLAPGRFAIQTVRPNGTGRATILSRYREISFPPRWSPDGKRIVFSMNSADGRSISLYIVNANGAGLRKVSTGRRDNEAPAWSRDGTKIAFSSDHHIFMKALNTGDRDPGDQGHSRRR